MQLTFEAVSEAQPGAKWQALFRRYWPAYKAWFLNRGGARGPTLKEAKAALRQHMPELLPTFERLLELSGGDELAARFLSCYRPPAYLISCSQAALVRPKEKLLVRNYDLDPKLNEGLILHSNWNSRHVITTSEFLWGAADGMNDAGLAVSLAFGGRQVVGNGFGIPLILRYLLEVCESTTDAIDVLRRVPSHMAYNITLLDRRGDTATVQVAPDRPSEVLKIPVATNHQGNVEWVEHARFTGTVERKRILCEHIANKRTTAQELIDVFFKAPLYNTNYGNGFGTLYTAVYRPDQDVIEWRWPNEVWRQKFAAFQEGKRHVNYTPAGARLGSVNGWALPTDVPNKISDQAVADWQPAATGLARYYSPQATLRETLATVRAALSMAGCSLSPSLIAWFDQAEQSEDLFIPWEKLGAVWTESNCGRTAV